MAGLTPSSSWVILDKSFNVNEPIFSPVKRSNSLSPRAVARIEKTFAESPDFIASWICKCFCMRI